MTVTVNSDDSVLTMVGDDVLVAASTGRALLMGMADPRVAELMDSESRYTADAYGRLVRAAQALYVLGFGTPSEVERLSGWLHSTHANYTHNGYAANDTELFAWTLDTLVDTVVVAYDAFVRPLTMAELDQFWAAAKPRYATLGIPSSRVPDTWGEFRTHIDTRVAELTVVDAARTHQESCLVVPNPGVWRPAAWLWRTSAISLLPDRLRRAYQCDLDARDRRRFASVCRWSQRAHRLAPNAGIWRLGRRVFGADDLLFDDIQSEPDTPMTATDLTRRAWRQLRTPEKTSAPHRQCT